MLGLDKTPQTPQKVRRQREFIDVFVQRLHVIVRHLRCFILFEINANPLVLIVTGRIQRVVDSAVGINAWKFGEMIPDVESLEVQLSVLVVNERHLTALFGVDDVARQQIIVTEKYRRLCRLKNRVEFVEFFSQLCFRWKRRDDPETRKLIKSTLKCTNNSKITSDAFRGRKTYRG